MQDLQTRCLKFLHKWLNDKHLPQGIRPGMVESLEQFVISELAATEQQNISRKMTESEAKNEKDPQ